MARKRLTPANPMFLEPAPSGLETKSAFPSAPIADVARDAAATSAMAEMADTLRRAREEGLIVQRVPLAQIRLDHLVRDRIAVDDDEMAALVASIRARGQQAPIELVALAGGGYGLISGWRRCRALALLQAETGEDRFAAALALIRRPDGAAEAYQAMVEENEIRVGLSYYERARIAVKATEQGVYEDERAALRALFASASRPKRSKIGSFMTLVHGLGEALRFPEALPERRGLALAKLLEGDAGAAARLRAALEAAAPASPEAEQSALDQLLAGSGSSQPKSSSAAPAPVSAPASDTPAIARELGNGIWMRSAANGEITLSGPGLTPERRARLRDWLSDL